MACIQSRAYWEPDWFARYFLSQHIRTQYSRMHRDLFPLWSHLSSRGQKTVIAAPRGHAKTTIMLTAQVLHAICYGYEPSIVIIAQTQAEAESRVEQILIELRYNEALIAVFGHLAPKGGKGSKKGFTAQNGVRIRAISRGQSIRGQNYRGNRPSLLILDDVETLEEVQNPEQRQKTRDWLFKDVIPVGQSDGSTNMIAIGTCLHEDSLISNLLMQVGWHSYKYQAIEQWSPESELWEQWEQLYLDLCNPDRETDAQAFYEAHQPQMLQETQVLWPEQESYLDLIKMKVSMGRKAFYSEKQNEPFDPNAQLFNMEKARYFTWDAHSETLQCPNRTVALSELHTIVAFHDPCIGHDDQGDDAAIVVVGKDRHNFLYVLDAFVARDTPEAQLEAAVRLFQRWGFHSLTLEANGFQRILKNSYVQRFQGFNQPPRVLQLTQTGNKELRIANLQPYIEAGTLLFNRALPKRFFEQLSHFPTATHDDGPDALEGAIHVILAHHGPSDEIVRRPAKRRKTIRPE
jgi:predicted phage terminase large subunit-like protein